MPAKTSRADFAALVRRAGLALTDAQIDDIHANAWPIMERLCESVRGPADRDRAVEPAHTFKPEQN
jgi:hypothetical protein